MEKRPFDEIKSSVESQYPLPIASVFNRYRTTSIDNVGAKHKLAIELFEVIIKFICILYLQEARQRYSNFSEYLPQKEKSLDFLKRPSLGGFVGLLRTFTKLKVDLTNTIFLSDITEWFMSGKTEEGTEAFYLLKEVDDINTDSSSKNTPVYSICNAFVNIRNKQLGHGSLKDHDSLNRNLDVIEKILSFLLKSASFLKKCKVINVERIEVLNSEEWKISASHLEGNNPEPISFKSKTQIELSELYVISTFSENEQILIKLGPFIIWHMNEDLKRKEIYFYNDAMRTKLEYISYVSGNFYYHKELFDDFRELLNLKLSKGLEEDQYRHLSTEEKSERAEHFMKKALMFEMQGKLEDAIEFVEHSIEFQRDIKTIIKLAELQEKVGDSKEAILQTLRHASEIDPDDVTTKQYIKRLEYEEDEKGIEIQEESSDNDYPFPTIFHVFVPKIFRKYPGLFYALVALIWFIFSEIIEIALLGKGLFVAISLIGILTGCLIFAFGLTYAKKVMFKIKLPLSFQLDKMRMERFEQWFEDQFKIIFGNFIYINGKVSITESVKKEKYFYLGMIPFLLILDISLIIASESYHDGIFYLIKRFIDFGFIILYLYPCIRYVLSTTIFINNYSKLSIKPMLTSINDDGLRSFSRLFIYNIVLATSANVAFFFTASLVNTGPLYFDFPILFIISIVVLTWSVGMPLAIKRSAEAAKYNSVHLYSDHIEQSFREFIEDPGDEKLQRYQWLKKNQKVIKCISTWPLSIKNTLIYIVGGNLFLLLNNIWFVIYRLNLYDELLTYF